MNSQREFIRSRLSREQVESERILSSKEGSPCYEFPASWRGIDKGVGDVL